MHICLVGLAPSRLQRTALDPAGQTGILHTGALGPLSGLLRKQARADCFWTLHRRQR